VFDSNGNPLTNEIRVDNIQGYSNNDFCFVSVCSNSNGTFLIAWNSWSNNSGYDILGQFYNSSGSAIGNNYVINTYVNNNQEYVDCTALNDGNYLITWQSVQIHASEAEIY